MGSVQSLHNWKTYKMPCKQLPADSWGSRVNFHLSAGIQWHHCCSFLLLSAVLCQDTAHRGSRSSDQNWKHLLHVGRCPAEKLLIEPDSEGVNNIRGSAHACTPNKGEDKAVKVRAITRQIQIKDTGFNLRGTKTFLRAPSIRGGGRRERKGSGGSSELCWRFSYSLYHLFFGGKKKKKRL